MKKSSFSEAADKVVALKMRAIDILIERMIEPIEDIGNPEQLIGKKYETWEQEDFQRLSMIYGTKEPNPLSNLIFREKYAEVIRLERDEIA